MRIWKKTLSLLLALVMCLSLFPAQAFAEGDDPAEEDQLEEQLAGQDPTNDPQEEDEEPAPHVHSLVYVERVEPTCGKDGATAHWACESCDALFTDEMGETPVTADELTLPATGEHSWGDWSEDEEPVRVCTVCGAEETAAPEEPSEEEPAEDEANVKGSPLKGDPELGYTVKSYDCVGSLEMPDGYEYKIEYDDTYDQREHPGNYLSFTYPSPDDEDPGPDEPMIEVEFLRYDMADYQAMKETYDDNVEFYDDLEAFSQGHVTEIFDYYNWDGDDHFVEVGVHRYGFTHTFYEEIEGEQVPSGDFFAFALLQSDDAYGSIMVRVTFDDAETAEEVAMHILNSAVLSVTQIPINEQFFPDAAFRAYLARNVDWEHDGFISNPERLGLTYIDFNQFKDGGDVQDLTGLWVFPNLYSLTCVPCGLESLDLRQNPKLQAVFASGCNALVSLDLSANDNLNYLDVSNCSALTQLNVSYNALLGSTISGRRGALKTEGSGITMLDINDCDALCAAYVRELTEEDGVWTFPAEDPEAPPVLCVDAGTMIDAPAVLIYNAFPDQDFADYVIATFDREGGAPDGILTKEEGAAAHTIEFEPDDGEAHDLTGLWYFPELTTLKCENCGLTSLDLYGNPELVTLDASGNAGLASLDLSRSANLLQLDLSGCTALTVLNVQDNGDLSKLCVEGTGITRLNVTNCPILVEAVTGGYYEYDGVWYYGGTEANLYADCVLSVNPDTTIITDYDPANDFDEDFYAFLLENFDANKDGKLSEAEMLKIAAIEYVGTDITSLRGIEHLTNLTSLDFGGDWMDWDSDPNGLEEVDLSHNTKLTHVNFCKSNIRQLDVSALSELTYLMVGYTSLKSLDLSRNNKLEQLWCDDCELTGTLDLTGNPALWELDVCGNPDLEIVNISNCPALLEAYIEGEWDDEARAAFPFLEGMPEVLVYGDDGEGHYTLAINDYTEVDAEAIDAKNFPDLGFRSYVSEQFDRNHNGFLSSWELGDVDVIDYLPNNGAAAGFAGEVDLTGVEKFFNLEVLACFNLGLKSLDLSGNFNLRELYAYNNPDLETLDLSNNRNLEVLSVFGCGLTNLDLSNNTNLRRLAAYNTNIAKLDLSPCPVLLAASGEEPREEDGILIYGGTDRTDFVLALDPDTDIGLDDGVASLFDKSFYAFLLASNGVYSDEEDIFMPNDQNGDAELSIAELTAITHIYYHGNDITSLKGIEYLANLRSLGFSGDGVERNELSEVDLSHNTRLASLHLSSVNLGWLDLSRLSGLTYLGLYDLPINGLDLSNNSALEILDCDDCPDLHYLDLTGNSKLSNLECLDCGEGDMVLLIGACPALVEAVAEGPWSEQEQEDMYGQVYDGLCLYGHLDDGDGNVYETIIVNDYVTLAVVPLNREFFPDEHFREYVAYEYDDDGDYFFTVDELLDVDELDVSDRGIESLQGIQFFPLLRALDASGNYLNEVSLVDLEFLEELNLADNFLHFIDLSNNTALTHLDLSYNEFAGRGPNLTDLTALVSLDISRNNIRTLNLSRNTELTYLNVSYNDLTQLRLENHSNLLTLYCSDNRLVALDLSKCTALTEANCSWNQLETLTLGALPGLLTLNCSGNNTITALDVSKCQKLQSLNCFGNRIKSLNLSKNTDLCTVICMGNALTTLTLGKLTKLTSLNCGSNQLKTLDVSGCTALVELVCWGNQLTALNLSKNTALTKVNAHSNALATLTLSPLDEALTTLWLGNNNLKTLDLSGKTNLSVLQVHHNQLSSLDFSDCPDLVELRNDPDSVSGLVYDPHVDLDGAPAFVAFVPEGDNPDEYFYLGDHVLTCDPGVTVRTEGAIKIDALTFPDANFRNYLTTYANYPVYSEENEVQNVEYVYFGQDGYLTEEELQLVEEINAIDWNIASLEGIQLFTNLKRLDVSQNQLTALDLSKNTNLEALAVSENQLTALDLSKNTKLKTLNVSYNQLTALDTSKLTALQELYCYSNAQLKSLNLKNNKALTRLYCNNCALTGLDLANNTNLTHLECHDNPQIKKLNLSKNTKLNEVNCDNCGLTSLTLGKLTKVDTLFCRDNALKSVDLSGLTGLQYLYCTDNALTALNLSKNTKLLCLVCDANAITSLDLSANTELETLFAMNNKLKSLDLSPCPSLKALRVEGNALTSLDLTPCLSLSGLREGEYSAVVDGVAVFAKSNVYLDPMFWSFATDILTYDTVVFARSASGWRIDEALFPDPVIRWYAQGAFGDYLSEWERSHVTDLDAAEDIISAYKIATGDQNATITSAQGLGLFTELKVLFIRDLGLTDIDVSRLTKLQYLDLGGNALTSIDLSNCKELVGLGLRDNQLSSINLANNTKLETLIVRNNQLTALNVTPLKNLKKLYCDNRSHGDHIGNSFTKLDLSKNTLLEELYCADLPITSLSLTNQKNMRVIDCSDCALTSLSLGTMPDLCSLNCSNNKLKSLDLSKTMTAELEEERSVNCSSNALTKLTLGKTTTTSTYYLQDLDCRFNSLSSLTVSNCSRLNNLYCNENKLTSLTISGCPNLGDLNCSANQLKTLDVSGCGGLDTLDCSLNQLAPAKNTTGLKLNPWIRYVYCESNKLTSLDLSACTILEELDAHNNQLASLDISACEDMYDLDVHGNKLTRLDISNNQYLRDARNGHIDTMMVEEGYVIYYSDDFDYLTVDLGVFVDDGSGILPIDESTFPDPVFRDYVAENFDDPDDKTPGALSEDELAAVTQIGAMGDYDEEGNWIDDPEAPVPTLHGLDIASLDGIQFFPNLQQLYVIENDLTSLDVSKNPELTILIVAGPFVRETEEPLGELTELDLSNNTKLQALMLINEQFESLDVSKLTALTGLLCANNPLTSLDVSKCKNLKSLVCSRTNISALNLSQLTKLEMLDCSETNLKSLDVSKCTPLTELYCSDCHNLSSLTLGTKANLQRVECNRCALKSLTVSNCKALKWLYCGENPLTSLSVSSNTNLVELDCGGTQIKSLDVTKCTKLQKLWAWGDGQTSPLATLSVKNLADLRVLEAEGNPKLTALDLTGCTALLDLRNTGVCVPWGSIVAFVVDDEGMWVPDDEGGHRFQFWGADPLLVYDQGLSVTAPNPDGTVGLRISKANFPDDSFCEYVSEHFDTEEGSLGYLTKTDINAVTEIDCPGRGIETLDGIQYFPNLTTLYAYNNDLRQIDLSKNTKLAELAVSNNHLWSLDLTKNTKLTALSCNNNDLDRLDLSKNTLLTELYCTNNHLDGIDLTKNTKLREVRLGGNHIETLDVSKNTALEVLGAMGVGMRTVKLGSIAKLKELYLSYNQLTGIDLSKCTALEHLAISDNRLTALNVTKNTKLLSLVCNNNEISALDVSKNTALFDLECGSNQIRSLFLRNNPALTTLDCPYNPLETLDLGGNTQLANLFVWCTGIQSLNIDACEPLVAMLNADPAPVTVERFDCDLEHGWEGNYRTAYFPEGSSEEFTFLETDAQLIYGRTNEVYGNAYDVWTWFDEGEGGVEFVLYHDGTLTVSPLDGPVEIPARPREYVRQLDEFRSLAVNVVIEDGITAIGENFFEEYWAMENLSLPASLERIGDFSFYRCGSLESVQFRGDSSLTQIGSNSFTECWSLHSFVIPEEAAVENDSFDFWRDDLTIVCLGEKARNTVNENGGIASMLNVETRGGGEVRYRVSFEEGYDDRDFYSYDGSENVTLLAIPDSDEDFVGWFEDGKFVSNEYELSCRKLDFSGGPITLTAIFAPLPVGLSLSPSSISMLCGDEVQLTLLNCDWAWIGCPDDVVTITSEAYSENGDLYVTDYGAVTAANPDSGYVYFSVDIRGQLFSAMVPVTAYWFNAPVSLATAAQTKPVVELFKTDYTELPIKLTVVQDEMIEGRTPEIVDARFTEGSEAAAVFDLEVVGGKVYIVPKNEYVFADAATLKTMKSSYKGTVEVSFDGEDYMPLATLSRNVPQPQTIQITLKQSKPSIKAPAIKLNSFFGYDRKDLSFTGGTVTDVALNGSVPEWLRLIPIGQGITELDWDAYKATKKSSVSTTLPLLVGVEGWTVKVPVSVSVSAARNAPTLKLAKSTLTLNVSSAVYNDAGTVLGYGRVNDMAYTDVTPSSYDCNFLVATVTEGKNVYPVEWVEDAVFYLDNPETGDGHYESRWVCEDVGLMFSFGDGGLEVFAADGFDDAKARTFTVALRMESYHTPWIVDNEETGEGHDGERDYVDTKITVKTLAKTTSGSHSVKTSGQMNSMIIWSRQDINYTVSNYNGVWDGDFLTGWSLAYMDKGDKDYVLMDYSEAESNADQFPFEVNHLDRGLIRIYMANPQRYNEIMAAHPGRTYYLLTNVYMDHERNFDFDRWDWNAEHVTTKTVATKLNITSPKKAPAPSATMKATGTIEVIRPESYAVLNPDVKNIFWMPDKSDFRFYTMEGKNKVYYNEKDCPFFLWYDYDLGGYCVKRRNGMDLDPNAKYYAEFVANPPEDCRVDPTVNYDYSASVQLPVKMGTATISLSGNTVTVKKDWSSSAMLRFLVKDNNFMRVDHVVIDGPTVKKDGQSVQVIRGLANPECNLLELGWNKEDLDPDRFDPDDYTKSTASVKVKVKVFLEGNVTATPNATLTVTVNLQNVNHN